MIDQIKYITQEPGFYSDLKSNNPTALKILPSPESKNLPQFSKEHSNKISGSVAVSASIGTNQATSDVAMINSDHSSLKKRPPET